MLKRTCHDKNNLCWCNVHIDVYSVYQTKTEKTNNPVCFCGLPPLEIMGLNKLFRLGSLPTMHAWAFKYGAPLLSISRNYRTTFWNYSRKPTRADWAFSRRDRYIQTGWQMCILNTTISLHYVLETWNTGINLKKEYYMSPLDVVAQIGSLFFLHPFL